MICKIENIEIEVTKKRIRSFRLRVSREGEVFCSVPNLATKKQISDFINSKSEWIKKTSAKIIKSNQKAQILDSGSAASKFGLTEDDFISPELPSKRSYSKKWKETCKGVFSESISRHLKFFESGKIPEFTLKMRAMKSLWGSCNRKKNIVTLNYELLRFPQKCIDYVVFHELTHFLFINHDKNFYGYISHFMPDYKERVKEMR